MLTYLLPVSIHSQTTAQVPGSGLYGIFNNATTRETRIIALDAFSTITDTANSHRLQNNTFGRQAEWPSWYGSATLAYDQEAKRFYFAGRLGAEAAVWSLNSQGRYEQISHTNKELYGHCITKMATGPDGNVYALTTPMRGSQAGGNGKTMVIRIRPSSGAQKPRMEMIGFLSGKGGYRNALAYSGDMAFAANGDLYIFGTEIDTVLQYYKGAHFFRIAGASLKNRTGNAAIPVENLGMISGMGKRPGYDSTVINGVAFAPDGSFILSTVDKVTQSRTYFFRGDIQPGATRAYPFQPFCDIPPGFVIGDLASGCFPPIPPQRPITQPIAQHSTVPPLEDWEKSVSIRTYHY
jgi:hypothetical protein